MKTLWSISISSTIHTIVFVDSSLTALFALVVELLTASTFFLHRSHLSSEMWNWLPNVAILLLPIVSHFHSTTYCWMYTQVRDWFPNYWFIVSWRCFRDQLWILDPSNYHFLNICFAWPLLSWDGKEHGYCHWWFFSYSFGIFYYFNSCETQMNTLFFFLIFVEHFNQWPTLFSGLTS